MKNKLFFFGSWERYQARRGVQQTFTVPTARMRAGDFSEVAAAYPAFRLYDPNTGGAGGVGRAAVPELRSSRPTSLNPTSQSILSAWPTPNTTTDINRNGLADDYVIPRTVTNDRDNFDLKLTYQRTNSHSIWAQVLDARRRGHRQLHPRLRRRQPRRHAGLRRHARPHLDAQPDAGARRQLRLQPPGPDGHRPRLRHELRHRRSGSPARTARPIRAERHPLHRGGLRRSARRPAGCRSSARSRATRSARPSPRCCPSTSCASASTSSSSS